MRGKTKSLFSLNFFSKNSRCSCDCPINLRSHLLAAYPRSVGGLKGPFEGLQTEAWSCENAPMMGTNSNQICLAWLQIGTHCFHAARKGGVVRDSHAFCIFS